MRTKTVGTARTWTLGSAVVLVATAIALVVTPVAAAGRCATAQLDEPFVLPDGSVHAGGRLTLCLDRAYSPRASLHEIRIDGRGLGLFVTRHEVSEAATDDGLPFMMFERRAGRGLVLLGIASPEHGHTQVYVLEDRSHATDTALYPLPTRTDDSLIVMVRADSR